MKHGIIYEYEVFDTFVMKELALIWKSTELPIT